MSWDLVSILLGFVGGGLLMWLVDWFFYGSPNERGYKRGQRLQERLDTAEQEINDLTRRLQTSEALLESGDNELVMARADAKEAWLKVETLEKQLAAGVNHAPKKPEPTRDAPVGTAAE